RGNDLGQFGLLFRLPVLPPDCSLVSRDLPSFLSKTTRGRSDSGYLEAELPFMPRTARAPSKATAATIAAQSTPCWCSDHGRSSGRRVNCGFASGNRNCATHA